MELLLPNRVIAIRRCRRHHHNRLERFAPNLWPSLSEVRRGFVSLLNGAIVAIGQEKRGDKEVLDIEVREVEDDDGISWKEARP